MSKKKFLTIAENPFDRDTNYDAWDNWNYKYVDGPQHEPEEPWESEVLERFGEQAHEESHIRDIMSYLDDGRRVSHEDISLALRSKFAKVPHEVLVHAADIIDKKDGRRNRLWRTACVRAFEGCYSVSPIHVRYRESKAEGKSKDEAFEIVGEEQGKSVDTISRIIHPRRRRKR